MTKGADDGTGFHRRKQDAGGDSGGLQEGRAEAHSVDVHVCPFRASVSIGEPSSLETYAQVNW